VPSRRAGRGLTCLLFALALTCAAATLEGAWAQTQGDNDSCARPGSSQAQLEAQIAACSRLIQSSRTPGAQQAWLYNNRGRAYAALGERERAIQDYDQAIRLAPKDAIPYFNRGMAYAQLGQREREIADFGQVIRLDPNNASAYNGRCYALAVVGRAAEGLPDCDRALQLRPNHAATLDSRAYAYLRLGRLDEASRDYDAAIAAGDGPMVRFGRAIVRARLGDRAGAEADLAEARRLSPTVDADATRVALTAPTFVTAPINAPPTAPGAVATPPIVDREVAFWQSIQASANAEDFEAYLRQFPNGTFTELARSRIAALRPAPTTAAPTLAADDLTIVSPHLSWVNRASDGQAVLVIEGVIRNAATAPHAIPPLRVVMRAGEVEIHSWTFSAAAPQVAARGEVSYRTEIADPPQASTLSVIFTSVR
jgi:tetratricopeptide (TPR) repeat protein